MLLDKVFADIASNVKHARVERRTKSRLSAYLRSPKRTYSRLYAHRRTPNGEFELVPGEADIVKRVFSGFAEGKNAQEIKKELDARNLRNRAGYRWTTEAITGLIRPVYAGLVPQRLGYKRSAVYAPIVTRQEYERAAKSAQRQVESVGIVASAPALGGRSWNVLGIGVKGCGRRLSEALLKTADRVATLADVV